MNEQINKELDENPKGFIAVMKSDVYSDSLNGPFNILQIAPMNVYGLIGMIYSRQLASHVANIIAEELTRHE